MDEMDITSAESKATYEEIKKYVAEHNDGMKYSETLADAVNDYKVNGANSSILSRQIIKVLKEIK